MAADVASWSTQLGNVSRAADRASLSVVSGTGYGDFLFPRVTDDAARGRAGRAFLALVPGVTAVDIPLGGGGDNDAAVGRVSLPAPKDSRDCAARSVTSFSLTLARARMTLRCNACLDMFAWVMCRASLTPMPKENTYELGEALLLV